MGLEEPIYKAYPKVKPLALALIAAAAEQGATAEEFELACQMVKARLEKSASGILLSELQEEEAGCFGHVLRGAAAKIAAACMQGEGEVRPLEDLEDPALARTALGLYRALMKTAEGYMGCRREKGAVMCRRQEETGWPGSAGNEDSQGVDIPQK